MPASPSVRIAPYRSIAAAVSGRLLEGRGEDPLAPWREEVIVPSRGMSEAIASELLQRVPTGVAGVQLRFIDDLARAIVNAAGEFPRVASDIERRLAMRMAVRAVEHPMMEGRGIAAMLERSYRDVRDGGLTVDELARRSAAPRSKVIVRVWREYERLIASFGAIDGADLLLRAASLAPRATIRPQLLAGFYDMTGVQLGLVKALPLAAVWVPADLPFARRLISEFGGQGGSETPPALPPHSKTAFDTRYSELRAVCAEASQLTGSVAIVARSLSPYDARLLNRFAAEFGFATTLSEEMPLQAHRIGRAVLTLLRLKDRGFPRAEVLELVRDGLHLKTRLDADAVDAATRRARIAGGTSNELKVLRNRNRQIDDYITLVAELESLEPANLGSLVRIETEHDLAAAEALDEITATFQRANAFHDTASVIDAIEHTTIRRPLPPARRPLVWAGNLLHFRGRTVDHLFVIGMQDDVFPQRRIEDPLLPDAERKRIGLREIGDGADEERLLFQLVLDSAANVRFTYATGDGFGKVLRPSRFVRARLLGCSVAELLGPATQQPSTPATQHPSNPATQHPSTPAPQHPSTPATQPPTRRQLQLLATSGTRSRFDGYIPNLEPLDKLTALSPTQLEDFGECPQKFLLKHLLGVEDLDHPEREIQVHHRDKGTLDHGVLERFYRGLADDELAEAMAALPRLPDALAARLDHLIDEAFDKHEQEVPPFNRTVRAIERRATKRLLREFVINDLAELHASGLVPRHFEFQFGAVSQRRPSPSAPAFSLGAVKVEGTIDRIDVAGGKFRIVDYKSGKALRHDKLAEKIDRGVRLQLALYAMAVTKIFGADPQNVSGTIKPLVVGEGKPRFAFELHEKQERLLETLTLFTNAISAGLFPAFPSRDDDFDSCKYCPVNHSCRTRHDLDERYAIQQQKDPRTLLAGDG